MSIAARKRFEKQFTLTSMIDQYTKLCKDLVSGVVLVDLDGVIADWDAHFHARWEGKSSLKAL